MSAPQTLSRVRFGMIFGVIGLGFVFFERLM